MKQSDLCEKFVCGAIRGTASNMHINGNKIYSYGTVLAQRTTTGHILLNKTKYSSSTSRQQSYLNYEISRAYSDDKIIELKDVPMWRQDLRYFL